MSHPDQMHPTLRWLATATSPQVPTLAAAPLETESAAQSANRAYDALISRLADEAPDGGWPIDVDLVKVASPLSDAELAMVCSLHAQAVIDELSVDPTLIAAYLRRELSAEQLLTQLRVAAEAAVCQVLRSDVVSECENRNELAAERATQDFYGSSDPLTLREQQERDFGVRSLFK